jgi:hypothetical protein
MGCALVLVVLHGVGMNLRRRAGAGWGLNLILSVRIFRPGYRGGSGRGWRELVVDTYRQRFTLTSGRFAMIDNGPGFALI